VRNLGHAPWAAGAAIIASTLFLAAASAGPQRGERRSESRTIEARTQSLGAHAPTRSARTGATWCGTPSQSDQAPNVVAGYAAHWIYAIPADGQDRFATFASRMQTDAEGISAWWRGQDATRVPRNDLAQLACGAQLDVSMVRLPQSGAQLSSVDVRFEGIVTALRDLRFDSQYAKYLVYYDGPVEATICGQGGSFGSGLGFAIVYVQGCPVVPLDTTAIHELVHTYGAVAAGAPHECASPDEGHVCEAGLDLMYPFGDETPLTGLSLDVGRDDYYGHSGSWLDVQDSPWLVRLDQQLPFALAITGPGSVTADVPGLQCVQSCTTTWNAGSELTLTAAPSAGAKLVRWTGGCGGSFDCNVTVGQGTTVSALFAPITYRLVVRVGGRGVVRSSNGRIACPGRCAAETPSWVTTRLTAKAAKGWRFKSWSGACKGRRSTCALPMTAATNARAVFVRTRR
jgi:hypothetical protein